MNISETLNYNIAKCRFNVEKTFKYTDSFSRSETVAAIYFQKAKHAKRIYAICPCIKTNSNGYKEEEVTHPSTLMQSILLMEIYNERNIDFLLELH